jgi:hypothetical protein
MMFLKQTDSSFVEYSHFVAILAMQLPLPFGNLKALSRRLPIDLANI